MAIFKKAPEEDWDCYIDTQEKVIPLLGNMEQCNLLHGYLKGTVIKFADIVQTATFYQMFEELLGYFDPTKAKDDHYLKEVVIAKRIESYILFGNKKGARLYFSSIEDVHSFCKDFRTSYLLSKNGFTAFLFLNNKRLKVALHYYDSSPDGYFIRIYDFIFI